MDILIILTILSLKKITNFVIFVRKIAKNSPNWWFWMQKIIKKYEKIDINNYIFVLQIDTVHTGTKFQTTEF